MPISFPALCHPAGRLTVYVTLLALAVATLPMLPNPKWKPAGGDDPNAGLSACLDQPIVGDWNGNGVTELGIFRGVVGQFYLDNQNPTAGGFTGTHTSWTTATFGQNGDIPVAANWGLSTTCTVAGGPGANCDQIGVYRGGTWYVNATGDGVYHPTDPVYHFGGGADIPVTGNWNGTASAPNAKRIGVFSGAGVWWVDINNDHIFSQPPDQIYSNFGTPSDLPVVGGPWTALP